LEPSRTNAIEQSEFVDSWGVKTNISVVSNDGISPEGVTNASNIYPTTTGASFFYEGSITYTSGTTYTYSVFAKANGKDYLQITTSGASFSNQYCTFDLALGATDNNGFESVGIEDYGNGWLRCYVVETSISTASSRFVIGLVSNANAGRLTSVTADGSNGILIYGVVSEAGSYPTSYIPTYGTSLSRAVDDLDTTFASAFDTSSGGTAFFHMKGIYTSGGDTQIPFRVRKDSGNYVGIGVSGANWRTRITTTSAGTIADISSVSQTNEAKIAIAWSSAGYAIYVNGAEEDSNTTSIADIDEITDFFTSLNDNRGAHGMKQYLLIPSKLTNAELAALTSL
jgi:hypothetical protein